MSNDCKHKYLIVGQPQFIPANNYTTVNDTTTTVNDDWYKIQMYECLCCGKTYAKECIPMNSTIIKQPEPLTNKPQ